MDDQTCFARRRKGVHQYRAIGSEPWLGEITAPDTALCRDRFHLATLERWLRRRNVTAPLIIGHAARHPAILSLPTRSHERRCPMLQQLSYHDIGARRLGGAPLAGA